MAREHHHRGFAPAQQLHQVGEHLGGHRVAHGHRQSVGHHAASAPGGVGGQDQAGDVARCAARGLHRLCAIGTNLGAGRAGAHPMRGGPRQTFGVGGERRVKRAVVDGMVANQVDHGGVGAARVVDIGNAIGKPRPAMKQGGCGFTGHAAVTIGTTGDHGFGQAQHAAHARHFVQGGHEMHLGCAWVGKTGVHPTGQQAAHQTFSTVHLVLSIGRKTARFSVSPRRNAASTWATLAGEHHGQALQGLPGLVRPRGGAQAFDNAVDLVRGPQ